MTIESALRELNNAVLDLQAADYNTYERPLKRLAKSLSQPELKATTDKLKAVADFDAFVKAANAGGSMMGSARLNWPDDRQQELGLAIQLIERGGENPAWFMDFAHTYYYAGSKLIAGIRKITSAVIVPFARDYKNYVETQAAAPDVPANQPEMPGAILRPPTDLNRVFIVHGHDDSARETIARFIEKAGFEPVILHEQVNRGMTIPEKLAANANVGFAVVLLTPDDLGRSKASAQDQPRARQNVILELGYFVGRLGRDRVCALLKDTVEIPSDFMGVVYTPFDANGGWRRKLALEMEAAGYNIDWPKVMRAG